MTSTMTLSDFYVTQTLIGKVAEDVGEKYSILTHIDCIRGKPEQRQAKDQVLAAYSFDSSGYDDEDKFIEHLQTVQGLTPMDFIRDMRRWLAARDPH